MFEAFPSTSFPSTRWLFIVRPDDAARYEHLLKLLGDVPGATVIIDRRHGERRRTPAPATPERRRLERRVRRPEKNGLGYALVRFTVRDAEPPASSTSPDAVVSQSGTSVR